MFCMKGPKNVLILCELRIVVRIRRATQVSEPGRTSRDLYHWIPHLRFSSYTQRSQNLTISVGVCHCYFCCRSHLHQVYQTPCVTYLS
ncbi:hypothetical protein DsansV1_C19g0156571 [Dioscorea sansibarensis]